MATLFNEIFSAIRGRCISDESASVAAAEVAELVVKKFTPTNKPSAKCQCGADAVYHYCHICWCMEIDSQKQADTSHVG